MAKATVGIVIGCLLLSLQAVARDAIIAVTASFRPAFEQLQPVFEQRTGFRLTQVSASSGKLFAQILQSAPYDAFLAADMRYPSRLIANGKAHGRAPVIYAKGQLMLIGKHKGITLTPDSLMALNRIVIPNPEHAPFGRAALQTLRQLLPEEALKRRLAYAQNVAQAFQFVALGSAEAGFVSLPFFNLKVANVSHQDKDLLTQIIVPADFHEPVVQGAVLLSDNPAARAFLDFLLSAEGRAMLDQQGFL